MFRLATILLVFLSTLQA
jgi:hypothetical protein